MSVTCGHPTLLAVYQRRLPAFVPSRCTQGHSAASIVFRASLMPSETSRRAGILSISSGTTTAPGAILLVLGSRDYELPSAPTAGTSRHSTALLRAFQRFPPPYFTSGRRLPCSRNLIKLNYASALFAVAPPQFIWPALAGPGRPWQATAGPGRLRQALAGLSPYVRVRSAPACPSQPSTGPAAAIRAIRG